jgi:chorismate synthase
MNKLRYFTAGESHGQGLVGILEGVPAGLAITEEELAIDLQRRQMGHGRGGRMKIEKDFARILTGVRHGRTIGSPIAVFIENRDWKNWETKMAVGAVTDEVKQVTIPRPGHADLAGAIKYKQEDIRNVLERASARETTTRVALGGIARKFLHSFGIHVVSHVIQIGSARNDFTLIEFGERNPELGFPTSDLSLKADASPVRCLNAAVGKKMMDLIDEAKQERDTVGGIFEVIAFNLPIGLGSHVQWDRKLDAQIACAMMSIQAIKGVEVGMGFETGTLLGSRVHDQIYFDAGTGRYYRSSNHAGGIEGGMTNGMPLVVRVAMKPISTLMRPLDSVDLHTKEKVAAHIERSDVCAVPAASVIAESVLSLVLANAFLDKFGGDSMQEIQTSYKCWQSDSSE